MPSVYLDWNATAPLRPEAKGAMMACLEEVGNPSSVHAFGRAARKRVEAARDAVPALVGANPAMVTFTGSGTEATALALRLRGVDRVLVSATEHAAVLEQAPAALRVPVDGAGLVDPAALDRMLAEVQGRALVSIQAANNETGVIQPLERIAAVTRAHGAILHSDAVQAAGRIPFDMAALGLDMVSLSAHKLGGPQGVGALVHRVDLQLDPLLCGGGQERRLRAGTENVAGIAGFGAAAAAARAGLPAWAGIEALRDGMEAQLREVLPDVVIFGADAPRLPNTCCVAVPGLPAETQLVSLDLAGIAVSSGAACSSGKVKTSHVLTAMGVPAALAACAIRVSLGWSTTADDIDLFVAAWARGVDRMRRRP